MIEILEKILIYFNLIICFVILTLLIYNSLELKKELYDYNLKINRLQKKLQKEIKELENEE